MIPVDEALRVVLATAPMPVAERVSLMDVDGRVAAADLVAESQIPPWDNSAMDGYAVRAADAGRGVQLTLIGTIGAGSMLEEAVGPGQAAAIMTGAPVPTGADAVIIVENTDRAESGRVTLHASVNAGENIRPAGGDVAAGRTVVRRGEAFTPAKVGLAASVGAVGVEVARRPVVAILSTGDEVVRPGRPLRGAEIYSSNPYALGALVGRAGGRAKDLGTVPDDVDALVDAVERGLSADALITTGGASVGRFDHLRTVLGRCGVDIQIEKVRMKPGKPFVFGLVERDGRRVPVFGLPGNPVSCLVSFHQFVRPWIRTTMGALTPHTPVIQATLRGSIRERAGRLGLIRVMLCQEEGHWFASVTGTQSSGVLTSMAMAHGLLIRPEDVGEIEDGTAVRVQVLDWGFLDRSDGSL